MKNLDLEIFLLCRPKNLITHSVFHNVSEIQRMTYPLSLYTRIDEYITENNYIKYRLVTTDTLVLPGLKDLRERVYEAIKNRVDIEPYP